MPLGRDEEEGSALLLVLFICLAAAVVLQAATGVYLCAQRALADESLGRQRLGEKNEILSLLRQQAAARWGPVAWTETGTGEGMLDRVSLDDEWVLRASARQDPSRSLGMVSGWVERGRDGVDLPMAAVVAGSATADPIRTSVWIGLDNGEEDAGAETTRCFFGRLPEGLVLGPGCEATGWASPWALSPGWEVLAAAGDSGGPGQASLEDGLVPAERVLFQAGRVGLTVTVPEQYRTTTRDLPAFVVLTGGATLDAQSLGDFYGVLVVDGGSLLLDGTVVHGAVFASTEVSLGDSGEVLFSRSILRWATDTSLQRARLVPGTRGESME
ncbi:MAG: hypothetical protein M1274_11545 [Actinobacteria bacterium]|nr:hypothetical protein [Actinomycetota bacterium]